MDLAGFLTYPVAGNEVGGYLTALLVFIAALIILKFFKFVVVRRLKSLSKRTKVEIDNVLIEVIDRIGWPFYILLALYITIALKFIEIPSYIEKPFYYFTLVVVVYYAVRIIQSLIDYGARKLILRRQKEEKEVDTSVIDLLARLVKGALWGIALILILANLGYDISALIAGLGVGGIAIAFALQKVLEDIFASFSIYFDKPFEIGDFIIIGDDLGVVKKIGIKSTRIDTLHGEELVVSNRELTSTRIHNYKKMKKRRVVFTFGVVYETPTKKLEKIPQLVKEIIDKVELADLDRVHFRQFGDFSLNFEVVYYVALGDYNKYMDIQQEINFALKEKFEKEGIEFAYPTQTIFVNK